MAVKLLHKWTHVQLARPGLAELVDPGPEGVIACQVVLRTRRAPVFDRWTYWEKFDYWAPFWGVTIIGVSG
jgi:hypothetical protein